MIRSRRSRKRKPSRRSRKGSLVVKSKRRLVNQVVKSNFLKKKSRKARVRRFKMNDAPMCPICLEHVKSNEKTTGCIGKEAETCIDSFCPNCCSKRNKKGCKEVYHKKCIQDWLDSRPYATCPTCRAESTEYIWDDGTRRRRSRAPGPLKKLGIYALCALAGGFSTHCALEGVRRFQIPYMLEKNTKTGRNVETWCHDPTYTGKQFLTDYDHATSIPYPKCDESTKYFDSFNRRYFYRPFKIEDYNYQDDRASNVLNEPSREYQRPPPYGLHSNLPFHIEDILGD